ncbi:MAG: YhbY family RNA-binding protein [Candidatus Bathyarchaeia archaeon]
MSKLTVGMKRRIKRELSMEKPTIWIGKGGASSEIIMEIGKQLDKNEMVKVKILKSALEKGTAKQIASKIAGMAEASLIEVRGHTFILYKRKSKVAPKK